MAKTDRALGFETGPILRATQESQAEASARKYNLGWWELKRSLSLL